MKHMLQILYSRCQIWYSLLVCKNRIIDEYIKEAAQESIKKEQERNELSQIYKTTRSNQDLEDVSYQKLDQNIPYGDIGKF